MIIVNLKGGLGNQMFQYAFGRHLALKHATELKLDTTNLTNAEMLGNTHRPFSLADFAIKNTVATPKEIAKLRYPYGIASKIATILRQKILRRSYVVFIEAMLHAKDNVYVDGYWQSPKYFESIRNELLKDFTLTTPLSPSGIALQTRIQSSTAVALHVRRGDYVANQRVHKENGVCSISYYTNAMRLITEKVPGAVFFVFSDDITWVKENIPLPKHSVFIQDKTLSASQELFLMSSCKHNIIANSSFSWWGAWLNQNPDKIVIAPTPWFDTIAYDTNLIPKTWIQLPKN